MPLYGSHRGLTAKRRHSSFPMRKRAIKLFINSFSATRIQCLWQLGPQARTLHLCPATLPYLFTDWCGLAVPALPGPSDRFRASSCLEPGWGGLHPEPCFLRWTSLPDPGLRDVGSGVNWQQWNLRSPRQVNNVLGCTFSTRNSIFPAFIKKMGPYSLWQIKNRCPNLDLVFLLWP